MEAKSISIALFSRHPLQRGRRTDTANGHWEREAVRREWKKHE
jgi:hypothetical protein